jgi:hypothetical protein
MSSVVAPEIGSRALPVPGFGAEENVVGAGDLQQQFNRFFE